MPNATLFQPIQKKILEFEREFHQISDKRKKTLNQLSDYISDRFRQAKKVKLIIICTHNSRRSHIGQIWLAALADYYNMEGIETYSGGTEATAFNKRVVSALNSLGFQIETKDNLTNPIYNVKWSAEMIPYQAFSKEYAHNINPQKEFAAIMVCSEAEAECPLVLGCDFRLSLNYSDPKEFDDTPEEKERYIERVEQIGRELTYCMQKVNK